MTKSVFRLFAVLAAAAALAACATTPPPPAPPQTKKLDAKTQRETGRAY
jgi:predicted small lipoprotein YifL